MIARMGEVVASYEQSEAAQSAASELFADDENITGIGIAKVDGGFVVRLNLAHAEDGLPESILGVPLSVRVVGAIRARSSPAR